MLLECFENVGKWRPVKLLRAFLRSAYFPILVVLLMVLSNLFSLELPVFYFYLFLGLVIVLFDDDLLGLVPISLCCYMAISYENNPALFPKGDPAVSAPSAFYDPRFVIQITFLIAAAVVLIAARLIVILMRGKAKFPALTLGFGALGVSFVLGGLFSKYYDFRTALFGFTVIVSLCALYFLFRFGVDWERTDIRHWAFVFCAIGCGLLIELLGMYFKSGMLKDPTSNRGVLQTGWGMYNNVGCILSMCIPATLYLAAKIKHGWLFTLLAVVQGVGLIFTQSRGSILFGGTVCIAALAVMLVKCERGERKFHLIVIGAALVAAGIVIAVMWKKFAELFQSMLEITFAGDPSNNRGPIYVEGWNHFCSAPFFGVGFYQCTAFRWMADSLKPTAFLPPRYHNTVIQLMASGGIFALGCYLLHRLETLVLLFRKPCLEKTMIALSIACLLLTSMVECHMFSFGPGMVYGVLLAYAEGVSGARPQPEGV